MITYIEELKQNLVNKTINDLSDLKIRFKGEEVFRCYFIKEGSKKTIFIEVRRNYEDKQSWEKGTLYLKNK